MLSSNKSTSSVKNSHKKSSGTKTRKHTKSSSSDNQDDTKKESDSSEGIYAVFRSSTIQCMAEQQPVHDGDLTISPEFYSRLAGDATYKLYELIHNVKTLAHPTGGVVTTEIVNDAIKLVDVPPVLGPALPVYQDVNYEKDGEKHYFPEDSLVNILEEIQSDISVEQTGPIGMKVSYFLSERETALIQTFYTKICRALLSGSTHNLKECLHILRTVEQFEPILPNLLTLCALVLKNYTQTLISYTKNEGEILEATNHMYERILLIIMALSENTAIRSATVHNELHHIVQYLTQILFLYTNITNKVTINTIDIKQEINLGVREEIKMEVDEEKSLVTDISIIDENNSSIVVNVNDIMECKNVFIKNENLISSPGVKKKVKCDIEDIEKICKALVAIGENWLCIRGKIIEILLPNLECDENDPQNMQQMKLLALATAKLLYRFDYETYFNLYYWMYEIYGDSILLHRPVKQLSCLDLQI